MIRGLVVVFALVLAPFAVSAQDAAEAGEKKKAAPAEADAETAEADAETEAEAEAGAEATGRPATYAGDLAAGHARYLATDYAGALEAYERAKEREPGNAEAYYFIGCAQAKLEQYEDAVSVLKTAATIAGSKNKTLHAKALFLVAVIAERRDDWTGARTAWTEYLGYAQTNTDAEVFVETAKARLEALEKRQEIEDDYAPVREKSKGGD